MFSIRKSQNVFRDVLFHNDVSYDKKDEERLCVLSHGGKSRDSSLPRFLFHPLRHSLVSFFLAMGFYWQACISQNSITWRESVHPVMGKRAGDSLAPWSLGRRRISRTTLSFHGKRKWKKIWRMYTAVPEGVAQLDNKSQSYKYHVQQLTLIDIHSKTFLN